MGKKYIKRLLGVPNRSFFLFGPRGVGKSTWIKKTMRGALFFNLLDYSLYLELSQNPMKLEALAGNIPEGSWIAIDEIQKIPTLLDEVHRLMEKKRVAVCVMRFISQEVTPRRSQPTGWPGRHPQS